MGKRRSDKRTRRDDERALRVSTKRDLGDHRRWLWTARGEWIEPDGRGGTVRVSWSPRWGRLYHWWGVSESHTFGTTYLDLMNALIKQEMDFHRMVARAREAGTLLYADHDSLFIRDLFEASSHGS